MATPSNDNCSLCDKIGLKPFTKENVLNYYIPIHGVVSYGALSMNVMNPNLFSNLMPKRDMTNVLLLSTLFGTSFYVYGRSHISAFPKQRRVTYAVLGSTLFSLGSVLAWAIIRSVLPKNNNAVATVAGLATGAVFVKLCSEYFDDCDQKAKI